MIFDKIINWKRYLQNPIFEEIFNNLSTFNLDTKDGIYKNFSDKYYFKVMTVDTSIDPDIIESHKKEVDIQILFKGEERIQVYSYDQVEITENYSSLNDCTFFLANQKPLVELILKPEYMAIFFEDDIHRPLLALNDIKSNLKKVVIKVNKECFENIK